MKRIILLSFLLTSILNELVSFSPEDVLILTDENYTEAIVQNDNLVILAYARWCKNSKDFKPEYLEAIKISKERNLNVTFATIESSKNKEFKENYYIQRYPTIIIFSENDKNITYDGDKNAYSLYKYLDKEINGPIRKLNTIKEIEESIKLNKIVLLCTFSEKKKEYEPFEQMSKTTNIYDFILCLSEECKTKYKEDYILFKQFDEPIIYLSEKNDDNSEIDFTLLLTFLTIYGVETGGKLTEHEFNLISDLFVPTVIYIRNSKNENHINKDIIFKKLHLKNRNDYYFLVFDINENEISKKINKYLQIEEEKIPLVMFIQPRGETIERYLMKDKEINEESIMKFLEDVKNNKILKELSSRNIRSKETQDLFSYHLIVGKTFDKEILEDDINIVFYLSSALFCTDCLKAGTIINELAMFYQNHTLSKNKIKFCQMDLSFNEMRGDIVDKIKSFPAFLLYLKNNKNNPILYKGNLNKDDIENWFLKELNWEKKSFYDKNEDL